MHNIVDDCFGAGDSLPSFLGTYGMQVTVDDSETLYVTDETPEGEKHYYGRFYFDPNSISMNMFLAPHQVFQGNLVRNGTPTTVVKIQFRKSGSVYYVDAYIMKDNNAWLLPISAQISDAVHAIEIEWLAAIASGANNGRLTLWVDGTQIGQRTGVDNDTHRIDMARLGTVTAPSGMSGMYCFDAFASRRSGTIGLESGAHGCGGIGIGAEGFGEVSSLADALPLVEITGTVPITGNIVALTETLPVTSSLALLPGLIVDVTTEVEIVIAGVITTSVPLTVTEIFSPTLEVDSLALYGLSTSPAPETLLAASYPWSQVTTIIYTYDALFRLTEASYNNGRSFSYEHDAVGNRLKETACLPPAGCLETEYTYNEANRMTAAGVIPYDWDNNGNLTDDGVYTYVYDSANRLTAAGAQIEEASYAYNGLGDRVRQQVGSQVTTYTLDLASGLTQVLAGGTYTYFYGQGRIAQYNTLGSSQYFLGDAGRTVRASGSVRQLVGATGSVVLAKSYEPYGETLSSAGSGSTIYSYTGEIQDAYTNFVYLRARYYAPQDGRFLTRDTWRGNQMQPMSYNAWLYTYANPVNLTDPSGHDPWWCEGRYDEDLCFAKWAINNGGKLTADIIESISDLYPDETLRLLQQQFNIKLPEGYSFQLTAGGSIFGQIYNDTYGVNWWFTEYNVSGDTLEISENGCTLLSTSIPLEAVRIDYSIYITRHTFADWDYMPDDIAGIMIHEAVHGWQESVARTHVIAPGQDGDPSSVSWFYKYRGGMEVQAVDYALDAHDNGRIIVSNKLYWVFKMYRLNYLLDARFPYSLPPDVP